MRKYGLSGWFGAAVAAWAIALCLPASAQVTMREVQVADGVFMMQNSAGSGNSTFVITPAGVLVYDADVRTADQVLAAIRKRTNLPVRYLVTSHSAGDHATGAWHYRADKPVYIATRRQMHDFFMQEAAEFEERKASGKPQDAAYAKAELVRPDIGFDGTLTLQFGGLTFQLTEEGHAHSMSDVTVYIPQRRIMLMGDLLDTEIHPGQSESAEVFYANVASWVAALGRVMERKLPVDSYVPGHGPVHLGRGVADLEEQQRYFLVMRETVSRLIKDGKTLEQIRAGFAVPAEFAHYQRKERLDAFLKLYYYQVMEQGY